MRTSLCFLLVAFLALALRAQEAPCSPARSGVNLVPGTATLLGDHVNVRGQPAFAGEVVTRLKQGDVVEVLEVITRERPATGEPAAWAKIRMPTNTPVFVFTAFLDTTNKTVKAARLNLRGGPGENYSVVGQLLRGDQVTELLTAGDWTKIEAPSTAFAFVAAEFLQQAPPAPAPTPEAPAAPTQTPAPAPEPAPVTPPTAEPATPVPAVTPPASEPAPTEAPTVAPTPADPTGTTNAVPAEPTPPAADTNAPAAVSTNAPLPYRVVTREGIVRSTLSIAAPTEWELVDARHRRRICYLHPTSPDLKLVRYWEKRVRVTGVESLESRWPNTPVLTIQQFEPVPE